MGLKVFRISARRMIDATYGTTPIVGCKCLPEGYKVLSCRTGDWMAGGGVDFLIEHESFEEVKEGELIPINRCNCNLTYRGITEDQPIVLHMME